MVKKTEKIKKNATILIETPDFNKTFTVKAVYNNGLLSDEKDDFGENIFYHFETLKGRKVYVCQ